ncbi:related to ERF2 - protein involved in palmitoylation and localization of Ras2p [Cephalotrichum gorgonifer]|uniref:Palmitoyltransferase n=1 Tax=Cephalotrichum gorgonifer TaxID=2041049 RepID=A0AAE8MTQ3_9PEZI|nr:related to ERF2 - protein involved in palmitoylation and localization of Ras2p [Cephalotrichum gorgonifer]
MSEGSPRATTPSNNDGGLRAYPASIISSRMTDIASDDGEEQKSPSPGRPSQRQSLVTSESRPGTARTATSARNHRHPQPLRKAHLSGLAQRGSVGSGSVTSSLSRTPSAKGRSHVPTLTSNAFYHPMSSQKLQAQRGGARPPMMANAEESTTAHASAPGLQQGLASSALPPPEARPTSGDSSFNAPPSLGTEVTGQDTVGMRTVNTSPTYDQFTYGGSVTESVRPLHKNKAEGKSLNINTDRGYKAKPSSISGVLKSPRSFSGFLISGKSDAGQNGSSRAGRSVAEKLSSRASSPRPDSSVRQHTPREAAEIPPNVGRVGRVFEYFEGNTVFCLGGRWQNARQRPVNVATGLFIVIPAVLFFAFSAKELWHEVSPAIPIIFAYVLYICFSSFIHASVSDPGILPRNLHQFPPVADPLQLGPPTTDWVLVKSADKSSAAMEVPVKHCRTCNIWRPPRAHHCRLCDNCIETHDHHCVWLNNCVGRRNYRYFFAFVSSATVLGLYLAGTSLAQVLLYQHREGVSFGRAADHLRVPFAMVIYGLIAFLYPMALMSYHVFLMARGETTREYINSHKFAKSERYRAFTHNNWIRNWIVVLCRPRTPTYYGFKRKYTPGDQRLAEDRGAAAARRARERDETADLEMRVKGQDGFEGPVSLRSQRSQGEV